MRNIRTIQRNFIFNLKRRIRECAKMIRTFFEIIAVTLIIYGLFNENKLIELENKILRSVKHENIQNN